MQESEILEVGFGVFVDENSSYQSKFFIDCADVFATARAVLSSDYVSVIFPNVLPEKYCLLVDDDASVNNRSVSAIGTYLFGHFLESVPLYGPFLVMKYTINELGKKEYTSLTKKEADEVIRCLDEEVVPHIKNALKALLDKQKREKFTVL